MASFYICHPNPSSPIKQNQLIDVSDLSSACKLLRKAAIRLHQVSMKLQVSKVIRFLENFTLKCQKTVEKQQISQERVLSQKGQQNNTSNFVGIEVERLPSIMQISTTKSLMSSAHLNQLDQNNSIYKKLGNFVFQKQKTRTAGHSKENSSSRLTQTFKWREVVTKNELDEAQNNRRVRFKDNSITYIQDSQKDRELQFIRQENERLKKSVVNIFRFFSNKQLLSLPAYMNMNELQLQTIESISKDLFSSFEKRQVQLEFQRKKLMQVHSQYLLTLKNITIEQQLQKNNSKLNETSIVYKDVLNFDLPLQTINLSTKVNELISLKSNKVQQMKKQLDELQTKSKNYENEIKKYEMLLFIKQEQISSLRVLNSDLQNKLNISKQTEDRPRSVRSRSYKKYFKHLDQNSNMSSTFS